MLVYYYNDKFKNKEFDFSGVENKSGDFADVNWLLNKWKDYRSKK